MSYFHKIELLILYLYLYTNRKFEKYLNIFPYFIIEYKYYISTKYYHHTSKGNELTLLCLLI